MRPLLAVLAAALLAPSSAAAAITQFVGTPVSYTTAGRPAKHLTVAFRLNQPIEADARAWVQRGGARPLARARPTQIGPSGLCYRVDLHLRRGVSKGAVVRFSLDAGPITRTVRQVVRRLSAARAKRPQRLAGGDC